MSRLDSRLLRALDDWLFPERVACLCCDAALGGDDQSGLCPGCAQALSRLAGEIEALPPPAGIDEALAAFPYADQPRQLILMLKFNSVRAAALPLARAMSSLPLGVYDALVPVPTTRRRLRQRGFNQAQLLAERLGEIWGMPVLPALSRRDEHAAQTKLSAENRRRNLEGCMEADSAVRGLRVLVVDDVLTTGSTASEAEERFSPRARRGSGWLRRQKRLATRAAHCLRPCGSCPLLCRFYAENKKLCKSACNFFSLRL